MSVPSSQRKSGELDVNTKARGLTVYTFQILANPKWFPLNQSTYIGELQRCVLEIQALCWEANNIRVDDDMQRYEYRMELQDRAASKCNRMMMLIETAKPLFHLESRRVRFWIAKAKELRAIIRGWHKKDAERLMPKG